MIYQFLGRFFTAISACIKYLTLAMLPPGALYGTYEAFANKVSVAKVMMSEDSALEYCVT